MHKLLNTTNVVFVYSDIVYSEQPTYLPKIVLYPCGCGFHCSFGLTLPCSVKEDRRTIPCGLKALSYFVSFSRSQIQALAHKSSSVNVTL